MRLTFWGLLLAIAASVTTPAALAQTCDPLLQREDNQLLGYGPRQNRCEGLYRTIVTQRDFGGLEVVGVTLGTFQFDLDEQEVIQISSAIVTDEPVEVRAVGIPTNTYYRLDATIAPGQTLNWPVKDVILPAQLRPYQIGLYGWLNAKGASETMYVPLSTVAARGGAAEDQHLRVTLRATTDVAAVQWRLGRVVRGDCADLAKGYTPLTPAAYYSGQAMTIILPDHLRGEICLEVAAQARGERWLKRLLHLIARR